MNNQASAEFTYTREFNAPRKLVFNAFSNAEALNNWWGPAETTNTVISLDFRPGGIVHFKMASDNGTNYGRFLFRTIQPYQLLEFTNAFTDEQANVVKAPFDIEIPNEILYRLEFTEQNGKTILHMTGQAFNATAAETSGLQAIHDGMRIGFDATFDKLETYLTK